LQLRLRLRLHHVRSLLLILTPLWIGILRRLPLSLFLLLLE